jgi:hypothetical protein
MKSLFLNWIAHLAQAQLDKMEESKKEVGMAGNWVRVPHQLVLEKIKQDKAIIARYKQEGIL